MQATLNQQSGERRVLGGLQVVNRAKLKELDAEKVIEMLRSDELETIFFHLHSLVNLRVIGERMPQHADDTAPAPEIAPEEDGAELTKH